MLLIPLAAATIAFCPPAARAQDVDATIKRAIAAWSRVKTFRATFEQTIVNPLTGSSMVARGELQQRKPNKLAITFTDPAGDRIVGDGQFVWVYLQSATPGQVMKLANTDAGAASTDLIGQFLTTPRSKYTATDAGEDKVGARTARAIVLGPGDCAGVVSGSLLVASPARWKRFPTSPVLGFSSCTRPTVLSIVRLMMLRVLRSRRVSAE